MQLSVKLSFIRACLAGHKNAQACGQIALASCYASFVFRETAWTRYVSGVAMFSSLISVCFFSSSYFFFFLSRRRNLMYQNLCNRFPYLSWCVALAHVFGYYRLYKFNHTRYFELMSQNFRCSGVSYKISKKERVLPRQGHAARGVFRHCK